MQIYSRLDINVQIQKIKRKNKIKTPSRVGTKRTACKHIMVKQLKAKGNPSRRSDWGVRGATHNKVHSSFQEKGWTLYTVVTFLNYSTKAS